MQDKYAQTCEAHACCQGLGSGAVTTTFNDLGLSWPGIEPWSPACEEKALLTEPKYFYKIKSIL